MRKKNLFKMVAVVACMVLIFTNAVYGGSGVDPVLTPGTEETITIPASGPKLPGGPIVTPCGDPDPITH